MLGKWQKKMWNLTKDSMDVESTDMAWLPTNQMSPPHTEIKLRNAQYNTPNINFNTANQTFQSMATNNNNNNNNNNLQIIENNDNNNNNNNNNMFKNHQNLMNANNINNSNFNPMQFDFEALNNNPSMANHSMSSIHSHNSNTCPPPLEDGNNPIQP